MNDMINKVTDLLGPAGASALGHAVIGLVILAVGLFVVKFIVGIFKRLLKNVSVLNRTNADGSVTELATPRYACQNSWGFPQELMYLALRET